MTTTVYLEIACFWTAACHSLRLIFSFQCLTNAAHGVRMAARIVDTPCNEMNTDHFLDVSKLHLFWKCWPLNKNMVIFILLQLPPLQTSISVSGDQSCGSWAWNNSSDHSWRRAETQRIWRYIVCDHLITGHLTCWKNSFTVSGLFISMFFVVDIHFYLFSFSLPCFLSLYLVGIYGVGRAAEHPPALAVLSHTPVGATQTIAWVGKGIVYDTGGLSIKGKVILFFIWRSDKNIRHCETPMCSAFILVSVICLH